jgi:two-component system, chemotaxis family, chemotaxis protein CheY
MALETRPRTFAPYLLVPQAPSCRIEDDSGAGRTKLAAASSPDTGRSPRSHADIDTGDDHVPGPMAARQVSADVLVVDDDADVRWTVVEVLRSAGFSVAEAEDGEVALDLLSSGRYRMVLLDMRMPRRDGVSLIEAVEHVPPVVVHSAYTLDAADRERLGSVVVDYLHKPVSPQKLLRAVETVLGTGG